MYYALHPQSQVQKLLLLRAAGTLLSFQRNKPFVAFSNLNDIKSLTKTWKVSLFAPDSLLVFTLNSPDMHKGSYLI